MSEILPSPPPTETIARPGPVRRLYDWVLHFAHTPYGAPALAIISFCESSFFPLPPDPLLIALGISRPKRALWYGLLCTIASVIGGVFGYMIGVFLFDTVGTRILEFYGLTDSYEALRTNFREAGFFAILIAALTPVPYKVFTIAAGVTRLPLPIFISASLLGRGLRFIAVGWLIGRYGEPVRAFIDRWFHWLAWGFVGLAIIGFFLVSGLLGGGRDG